MTTHATPQTTQPLRDSIAPRDAEEARRGSYAAWIGLGVVGLLAVLVFWSFEALPFQDLPAHAGLIAMRHRFGDSAFEQRFFVLAPHIGPYSLFRFLGEGFVRVIGPTGAVRALASLPVIATPAALLFVRRRLFADATPTYGFVGLALSFGLMTLLGFASYLLGVAVMIIGLALWLDLLADVDDGLPTRRREITMALYAPFIFVAHGHAFALFLLLAFVAAITVGKRWQRLLRIGTLIPALGVAAWVAWIERSGTSPVGSVPVSAASLAPHFQGPSDKLSLLVTPTLMTRSGIDLFVGVLIWVLAIAGTAATIRGLRRAATATDRAARHSRALLAGAGALALLFLVLPHAIGWFGFVDGRLVPLVLILSLLALRRDALPRFHRGFLDYGMPVVASAVVATALVASYRFQDEARGYREVLGRVPERARLLNLPLDPNSDVFTAHPFIHYDKLVLAERPIVVSDVWFHQGSALYPTQENPALRLPSTYSESDLRVLDWPAYDLRDWDYILMRTRPDSAQPRVPGGVSLVEHRGGWWLFATPRPG